MADVYHENSRCLALIISFPDLQIIFLHVEALDTMIYLCIANAFSKVNLLHGITKLKLPGVRIGFISIAGFKSIVIAFFRLFKLAKNFFKAASSYALFCFSSYRNSAINRVLVDIAFFLQFVY